MASWKEAGLPCPDPAEAPRVVYDDTKSLMEGKNKCLVYEDAKCVADYNWAEAPQVMGADAKEVIICDTKEVISRDSKEFVEEERGDDRSSKTICGLRRRTFWLVLVFATLIVGGAIAGGVGGGLASRHKNEKAAAAIAAARYVLLNSPLPPPIQPS